jgi:NDP-4-keto-2,6-dideoxyhexose 3-C-methyltransferase
VSPEQFNHSPEFEVKNNCRVCSGSMTDVLEMGNHRIVSWGDKLPPRVPLTLALCDDCNVLQLRHTANSDLMWNADYGYRSGINATMREELADIASKGDQILRSGDVVLDIGCNDGTLLNSYQTKDIHRAGFDPSKNMVVHAYDTLSKSGDDYELFIDFFRKEPMFRHFGAHNTKVITAISMFYDLDNPNKFLLDVRDCLSPEGVFIVQQNYLPRMIKQNAFDNICHEHVAYYDLADMERLLDMAGMEVADVTENNLNGGRFRIFARHKGAEVMGEVNRRVLDMRQEERSLQLNRPETYVRFAEASRQNAAQLKDYVNQANSRGEMVYAYGASTRGGTLLQFAELDQGQIIGVADRNPEKWGKVMQTTGIPIVSEEEARAKADCFVVLPWFFKDEFVKREADFLAKGKKMIFPLPTFKII